MSCWTWWCSQAAVADLFAAVSTVAVTSPKVPRPYVCWGVAQLVRRREDEQDQQATRGARVENFFERVGRFWPAGRRDLHWHILPPPDEASALAEPYKCRFALPMSLSH